MDIIINVNNQSNGRDKLARLFQYTSRLVWHQLESRNANKYSVDRIKSLENALGSFRKVLRMGRCIDICYLALNTMNIEDPFLRISLTVSKIAHALYLYADHVVWLTKSGFLKSDTDNWNRTANRFWLLSIIANLARDFYEILHILELNRTMLLKPTNLLSGTMKQFDLQASVKHTYTIVSCHKDIFIDTLKNSCDIFIPLTALGFTKFSPSAVGALGAISSLAALVTMVKPITKLIPS
ncbi:peroxisomal membrane protein 11B [Vanessa atalanta]|uniref:peroxisomal membrane protein 11B n=1 Tax=Vanessa atalanta TaxID=42275 RepID=UPI001FCD6347|nr:peroxisomal membrane protein 11B [Vanessa atalanta]XP_047536117.1 peroxisomal membrane protein 11B [Vanessa atalanta]XP_047536118.1 peroxisomal membrane protein 11B [Vanessa atalanta]XP_047536119.1 peroxisomal membrane protein 11B [Vanessa atalanta]XP_047536120.1 peroxisomal membrane protein 11B [Vanessa atalanta]